MPKRKPKKKGAGAGSGGGSSTTIAGDAAGSSAVDLEAIGHGLENLDFMDPDEDVVEVVYVEPSLKRTEWVPFGAPISRDWLRHCVTESHGAWQDRLPSTMQSTHLTGRVIPEAAQTFSDITVGKGVVVVELQEAHTNQGLVGQVAAGSATSLTMGEANRTLMQQLVEMERRFDTKLAERDSTTRQEIEDLQREVKDLQREVKDLHHRLHITEEEHQRKIESLNDEMHQLRVFMKKGLLLSNKVKRRVALTLARTAVEAAVGRTKPDIDTWSAFVCTFSAADWSEVGITKKVVKDLLADGAYDFNHSIHNVPAEEVVGSIVSIREESLHVAWEEIFFIAFKKRVSDQVFAEEIDYAMHQEQMLGES